MSTTINPVTAPLPPFDSLPIGAAEDLSRRTQLAGAVLDFIATVSLEYGGFDSRLFNAIVDWLGPVAAELRISAILIPNTVDDPNMPAHEVVVLDNGEALFLFTTAWNPNIGQPVVVCARPPFEDTADTSRLVLLHATETIFKVSLSTPGSPFLPPVPHWIRRAG